MLMAVRPRESAMPLSRIRVLVVHSDPVARAGLSAALGAYSDIEVLSTEGALDSAQLALRSVGSWSADVVVADYGNGMNLAACVVRAPTSSSLPKVLIVSGSDREWEIRNAMERGVRGYLVVGCTLDDLAQGVRAVYRGGRHLSPQVALRLAESMSAESLTTREEEVLELVVMGLSNKAIARRLDIAVGTVKTHLRATFDKLGVESRTQAVIAVAKRGLLRGIAQDSYTETSGRAGFRNSNTIRTSDNVHRVNFEVTA